MGRNFFGMTVYQRKPVTDVLIFLRSDSAPLATTRPPSCPAPGPKSIIVSAARMVSLVVFDHQNAVAAITQNLECVDQNPVVTSMQTDGGFIQDITNPGEIGSQLGGQTDPLGFSTGKRITAAGQGKIGQTQVIEQRQPARISATTRLGDGPFLHIEVQRFD